MKFGVIILYESCNKIFFIPVHHIVSMLLTAQHVMEEENVLVTVPLIA